MYLGILSIIIFLPLLGMGLVFFMPSKYSKYTTGSFLFINLIASIFLYIKFDKANPDYQFQESIPWFSLNIGQDSLLKINYSLGVDGLSLPLILLASLILFIGSISSYKVNNRVKTYFVFYLLLSSSVLGTFLALDFFLFFLFFEFMLLPMFFLIGIWGGKNREYAAVKFLIYTLVGSLLILVVMISMGISYHVPGFENIHTLDFRFLKDPLNQIPNSIIQTGKVFNRSLVTVLMFLILIGFGIKLPFVPFHTWLPDAHVEASTPISVVLAGVLLKIGGYGLIRIGLGFFPFQMQEHSVFIATLAIISIIYAALNALAQDDLKKLIAYSSISHMGFVLLAIIAFNEEGLNAALFQMISHGILSAMLFLIAGVIYERSGNRLISNFRGLAKPMPKLTIFTMIAFFGSLGLPSLSGFIGEFSSIYSAISSKYIPFSLASLSVIGIILSAVYFLWTLQKMFFGNFWANRDQENNMIDLNNLEVAILGILAILSFALGLYPNLVFSISESTFHHFFKL